MKPVKDLPEGLRARLSGARYLWCRECHRTFQEGAVVIDEDTFARATQYAPGSPSLERLADAVRMRARCPYQDCHVPLRVVDWAAVLVAHPEYPAEPEEGVVYEGPGSDAAPAGGEAC